jgi:hypothetical protein
MSYLEAKNPGRWGYLIARFLALTGVVAVAGSLVLALYIFISRPTAGSLKLLTLPGTTTVSLEKSGLYNLYFDFMWTEAPRGLQINVRSNRTGQEITVKDDSANPESSWRDPDRYKKFASFAVEEPGAYEVSAIYNSKRPAMGRIFIGANYQPDYFFPPGALIGGLFVLLLGRVIASLTFSQRKRAAEAQGAHLVYQEKGISVYNNFIFLKKAFSATELDKSQINYVQQTSKSVSTGKSYMSRIDQGIKINYNRGGRERTRTFWSETYSKLYHAIKGAGYQTKWEPPK